MSLALWILATAGSALILTQSSIARPLRNWLSERTKAASGHHIQLPACAYCESAEWRYSPATGWRRWFYAEPLAAASKLVNCPMCSGFWLGLAWAAILGTRGVQLAAHAFGGSIVSALAVAAWILLQEAHQALALWRYNNPPRTDS